MAKSPPTDAIVIQDVVAAILVAREAGCPVAPSGDDAEVVARIAIRRWQSGSRRGVVAQDKRIRDLARGLATKFCSSDLQMVGPLIIDYEYLASQIAAAIETHKSATS